MANCLVVRKMASLNFNYKSDPVLKLPSSLDIRSIYLEKRAVEVNIAIAIPCE